LPATSGPDYPEHLVGIVALLYSSKIPFRTALFTAAYTKAIYQPVVVLPPGYARLI
jgi:hypothetical protein